MKDTDMAYAAGFFDGEGHVRCDMIRGYPHLMVTIAQNDRQPLEWLQILFGGHIRLQHVKKTGNCHNWNVNTTDAQYFLEAVIPFLMVKKAEAEEALAKWLERLDS